MESGKMMSNTTNRRSGQKIAFPRRSMGTIINNTTNQVTTHTESSPTSGYSKTTTPAVVFSGIYKISRIVCIFCVRYKQQKGNS